MNSESHRDPLPGEPRADSRWAVILYLAIPLVSLALHYHVFSRDLVGFHAWRQTQTQINIDNFYSEDSNIFHPRVNARGDGDGVYRTDFPLMQWLFALVYRLLWPDVLWSRILSFIIGIATLLGFHRLLRHVFQDGRHALPAVWAFCFSPLFYYYTVNPMPDNLALCFGVWGMAMFFRCLESKSASDAALAALLTGASVLVKLPFVVSLAGVGAYIAAETARSGFRPRKDLLRLALLHGMFLIPAIAWYAVAVPEWRGNGVVRGILGNTLPGGELLDIARFTLTSSLPELLVNYGSVVFFAAGIVSIFRTKPYARPGFVALAGWGAALLLYFSFEMNMIRYVHDYYLLPFLPPIFLIVAGGIRLLLAAPRGSLRAAAMVCLAVLPLTAFLRIDHRWNLESPGFNPDLLVYKDDLRGAVPDDALCVVGNDESRNIFFYYVDKKGWGFDNNALDAAQLREMIDRGARYLYSDSRAIDEVEQIRPLLGELLLERGTIRIYRLGER